MKKIAIILAALMLVCALTSCSLLNPTKTYTVQEMSITLDGLFYQQNDLAEEMDAVFLSTSTVIMINRLTPDELGLGDDFSTEDLATLYAELLGEDAELNYEDGVTYFITTMDMDGSEVECFYTTYTSDEASWLVAMIPLEGTVEDNTATYIQWAKSVTFTEAE